MSTIAALGTSAPLTGDAATAYDALTTRLRKLADLDAVEATLQWDELVMMPDGAAEARGRQKAALAELKHGEATSAEMGAAIAFAETSGAGEGCAWRAANIRDARRDYDDAVRVPASLKAREAELGARGYAAWHKAREANEFESFAPVLKELVALRKEFAAACADEGVKTYDYLLDQFERGMTTQRLSEIFGELRRSLAPVIKNVLEAPPIEQHPIFAPGAFPDAFPESAQERFCRAVATRMGFCFDTGRFDTSVHPFTGGSGPFDVRITTRYDESNFMDAAMGVIHEVGHALYEQGLNKDQDGLPVARALSMGIHESQSLFWERYVGQSLEFWEANLPAFHENFPVAAEQGVTALDVYRFVNKATAGFIRVDADELTYSMHVVLRFELERALFENELDVDDLPRAWNEKMTELLGVTPETDAKGVLQDVHWSDGSFGYFPSYTLGAMYAAQFFRTAREELGESKFDDAIKSGDFSLAREWLRDKIHAVGSVYPSADELCLAVTGSRLDPSVYVAFLEKKYKTLYGLE
jgi:carboxypeptidase Taq